MRIDNMVRTERYFCSLLLALLLDDSLVGVRAFIRLLVDKGIIPPYMADGVVSLDSTQVIAELAVKRDLQKYTPGVELPPGSPRDVVDIVLIIGEDLIAVEAKFFSEPTIGAIGLQLRSQREALRLLETKDYGISRVHQVVLTADTTLAAAKPPDIRVLHWHDIHALAEQLRGPKSYVACRLASALERYEEEFCAGRPAPSWAGVEGLEAVLRRCRTHGPKVVIGFKGGMAALKARTRPELESRPFKWDWAESGRGRKIVRNWIAGNQFASVIDGLSVQGWEPSA
jgi:hypothetical protein